MTTDIIEIDPFIILIEQSNAEKPIIEKCGFEEEVIGFAFYGSGNVELSISYPNNKRVFHNTKGKAISFFGNSKVEFAHRIAPSHPLQSISFFLRIEHLNLLSDFEYKIFVEQLNELIQPKHDFVEGPSFYMTPPMQAAVHKILHTNYLGNTRMLFLKSQITELQSHFLDLVAKTPTSGLKQTDREKLYQAREIINQNIEQPPSLSELSKLIGLNNNKLKKSFKELFGVPVFKYLQNERLNKAHEILRTKNTSIQEAAWLVGYESLSSFSNAFLKKFGFRPSEIKKR